MSTFLLFFTQEILENLPNPKQIFTGEDDDILDNVNLSPDKILKKLAVLKAVKGGGGVNKPVLMCISLCMYVICTVISKH